MKKIHILSLIAFLAAFLLFQIELIVAKLLLPGYGGSYMVWGSCMVFFQAALLGGYYFSHAVLSRMGISKYLLLHGALLLVTLLFFPGRALSLSEQAHSGFLAIDVFRELLLSIGPVFFLLSTISIVTQVWLSGSALKEKDKPYTLYAWSNLGSFAALLTYPFVFEYFFDLNTQLLIWRIAYVFLIGLHLAAWFLIPRAIDQPAAADKAIESLPRASFIRCFLLSAGAVMIFLAATNIVTVEIAPIPLIWIIPLSIYLLTFVLNFKTVPWYPKWIDRQIHVIIGLSIVLFFLILRQTAPVLIGASSVFLLLFFTCMYCQRKVLELKPRDNRHLTQFYLIISLGGFTGGLITSWIIPLISDLLLEYPLALFAIALTFLPDNPRKDKKKIPALQIAIVALFVVGMLMLPGIFNGSSNFLTFLLVAGFAYATFSYLKKNQYATPLTLLLIILFASSMEQKWTGRNVIYKKRNFYGIYQVYNTGRIRRFRHGATLHGTQIQDPEKPQYQSSPTTYYGYSSPVASVLGEQGNNYNLHKIGVIGLGAGTLAAYTKPGQIMDFYELDPEVYKIAGSYFTFLQYARGALSLHIGDGRLSLKSRPEAKYDLLIVDAFSGDAVPYHLITKEMLEIYRQHLNPGGAVLFHLSNRYFRLEHVLGRVGAGLNAMTCFKVGITRNNVEDLSLWGALTWDKNTYQKLVGQSEWQKANPSEYSDLRIWTDQYSSVLPIIKYDELRASIVEW